MTLLVVQQGKFRNILPLLSQAVEIWRLWCCNECGSIWLDSIIFYPPTLLCSKKSAKEELICAISALPLCWLYLGFWRNQAIPKSSSCKLLLQAKKWFNHITMHYKYPNRPCWKREIMPCAWSLLHDGAISLDADAPQSVRLRQAVTYHIRTDSSKQAQFAIVKITDRLGIKSDMSKHPCLAWRGS